MSATSTSPSAPPATQGERGFTGTVWLVALREITTRLRSKAFLWTSGLLVAVAAAGVVVPNLIGGDPDPVKVAVVGQSPVELAALEDGQGHAYFDVEGDPVDRSAAEEMLREEEVDGALVFGEDGSVTVVGLREPPDRAVEAFSTVPAVEVIDPSARDPQVLYFVSMAFGLLFFLVAMTFGTQIAQSVVEEKQTRIVEILLATVSARALLAGKILGNCLLAIGQVVAISVAALVGLAVTGQQIGLSDLGAPILWFVAFFIVGFAMVAALFAAFASLISRAEDIGSATTPVTTLVMIPYMLSFVIAGNETWTRILAWVPFSSPTTMPTHVYAGEAHWWEPIGALLVLAATTVVIVLVGERIYRNSLLRIGAKVPLREALKRARD